MSVLSDDTIYAVVTKLFGPIDPVGETHTDTASLENLKTAIAVTSKLVRDIREVYTDNHDRNEWSMKHASNVAKTLINELREAEMEHVDGVRDQLNMALHALKVGNSSDVLAYIGGAHKNLDALDPTKS